MTEQTIEPTSAPRRPRIVLRFAIAFLVGLLITGISLFVFDVVVSRAAGVVAGCAIGTAVVLLLIVRQLRKGK